MSKTLDFDNLCTRIKEFFKQILRVHGWYDYKATEFRHGIDLSANWPKAPISLRLSLQAVAEGNYLVITEFSFSGIPPDMLSPNDFLKFHGLTNISPGWDAGFPPGKSWKITNPQNLDAFLELYDHTARRFGKIPLFGG